MKIWVTQSVKLEVDEKYMLLAKPIEEMTSEEFNQAKILEQKMIDNLTKKYPNLASIWCIDARTDHFPIYET
jgi:hypothetical protein